MKTVRTEVNSATQTDEVGPIEDDLPKQDAVTPPRCPWDDALEEVTVYLTDDEWAAGIEALDYCAARAKEQGHTDEWLMYVETAAFFRDEARTQGYQAAYESGTAAHDQPVHDAKFYRDTAFKILYQIEMQWNQRSL